MTDLDFFIRQTAKQTMISESIVDRIIRDQWKYANKASHNLEEIEVKELGTFYPSPKKVANQIKKLIDKHSWALYQISNNVRPDTFRVIAENVETDISKLLKTKHYGKAERYLEKQGIDIRRYKEQCISQRGSGGSSNSENTDMQSMLL